jgi:hypothetical protein
MGVRASSAGQPEPGGELRSLIVQRLVGDLGLGFQPSNVRWTGPPSLKDRLLRVIGPQEPAEAERMPCGVYVDLGVVGGRGRPIFCSLEQFGAERHDLLMSGLEVINPQINVDLLRRSVWPLWRNMVRCELHSYSWLTVHDDKVPVIICTDSAAKNSSPELAFGRQVCGVKYHDLALNIHSSACCQALLGVSISRHAQ